MTRLVLLAVTALLLAGCRKAAYEYYPVVVALKSNADFPEVWLKPPYSVSGSEPTTGVFFNTRMSLKGSLRVYNAHLVQTHVKRFVYVKGFTFNGNPVVSATHGDTVYFGDHGQSEWNNHYYGRALHESVAQILIRDFPEAFDEERWSKLNPESFTYPNKTPKLWELSEGHKYDPKLIREGFLTERSKNSFKDDVIVTMGALMSSPFSINAHDRVRDKALLLIEFLEKIDPNIDTRQGRTLRKSIEPNTPPKSAR